MGLIFLLAALALGAALVRRLPFALYRFEAVALAAVLGLFGWTWLAFLLALVAPYDVALPVAVTASAAAVVASWSAPPPAASGWRPLEGGRRAWFAWGAATAATAAVFGRLSWTHNLPAADDGVWSAGSTWADYGLHASIVNHVAAASELPGDLPVANGVRMTYPFLVDFLSAMFLHGGMSLHLSLFLPGVLLALAVCQLVVAFGLRLSGHVGVGIGGLALALTTGSAAGATVAYDDWKASGKGLGDFLLHLPKDYSEIGERNAHVTNLVADAMLPQRSILFGLGVGLTALILLHTAREREDARLLRAAGVLIGLLPMAHPHTFLVTMTVLAALTVEAALRARALPVEQLRAAGIALALAGPQVVWQQRANPGGTGGRFRLGWMREPGESLPEYWWHNFGLMGLLFLAIPVLLWRGQLRARRTDLVWFLPALAVLAVTQLYAFQPFEYDNLKLLYWVYLLGGLFGAHLLLAAARRTPLALVAALPAALVIAAPGSLAIAREFQLRYQFASPSDVELATWVRENTPVDAVFAAADRPNTPVATLAGRSIVLGYRGWLYNFNVPYGERTAAVQAALGGRFDDPALRNSGAGYVLVGANEGEEWKVDRAALDAAPATYRNAEWAVYRLGPDGRPVAPPPAPSPTPSPSALPDGPEPVP